MYNDLKICGTVTVIIDPVDIQQTIIEDPKILKGSPSIKAMLAAKQKESFRQLERACDNSGHVLEYDDFAPLSQGRVEVIFIARPKTDEEIND